MRVSASFTSRCICALALSGVAARVAYAEPGPSASRSYSPARGRLALDRTDALIMLGLGAAAGVSRGIADEGPTERAIDGSALDPVIDVADRYGEGSTLGLAAVGLVALGRGAGMPEVSDTGEELASSLLAAWTMTWALKVAVGAKRPDGGPYSFPSGHTATAFAAAPIVARRLGPVAGCAAYALAGLTGLARIEDRRHHVEDVLVGAAIGIIAGRSFSDLGAFKFAVPKRGIGLGLSVRF